MSDEMVVWLRRQLDYDRATADSQFLRLRDLPDPGQSLNVVIGKIDAIDSLIRNYEASYDKNNISADAWVMLSDLTREFVRAYRDRAGFKPEWVQPRALSGVSPDYAKFYKAYMAIVPSARERAFWRIPGDVWSGMLKDPEALNYISESSETGTYRLFGIRVEVVRDSALDSQLRSELVMYG